MKPGLPSLLLIFASLLAACAGAGKPLPHSVYFLDGPQEAPQVWRLDADGSTRTQLTHEEAGVESFSVSPRDGGLAIVSDNQLFLLDGDGKNRRLVADGNLVSKDIEDYAFRGLVSNPVFSPDGRTLAYAFDGLHLYQLATGQDEHALTNLGHLLGETFVFSKEVYGPGPWSPDGKKLLITMAYYEGSTLAVMEPGAAQPYTRLRSAGPVCCYYSWTPDSRSVMVANPNYTTDWPGLWRYDAETGQVTDLVTTQPGAANYVGWPVQLRSGDLIYFHGQHFSPDTGIPLVMVRSRPDGSQPVPLRPEEFHIGQALWAEDGSLALILGHLSGGEWGLMLVRPDGSPLQVLLPDAKGVRGLAWGP